MFHPGKIGWWNGAGYGVFTHRSEFRRNCSSVNTRAVSASGVALLSGKGQECPDDVAAVTIAGIILWNGWRILGSALNELMDASAAPEIIEQGQSHRCHHSLRRLALDELLHGARESYAPSEVRMQLCQSTGSGSV